MLYAFLPTTRVKRTRENVQTSRIPNQPWDVFIPCINPMFSARHTWAREQPRQGCREGDGSK